MSIQDAEDVLLQGIVHTTDVGGCSACRMTSMIDAASRVGANDQRLNARGGLESTRGPGRI